MKRDRYRHALSVATAATTVGALTATGWITGAAAADYATKKSLAQQDQAAQAQLQQGRYTSEVNEQAREDGPVTILKHRPIKKRVTIRYIAGAAVGSTSVGSGGIITSQPSQPTQPSSSGSSSAGNAAPPPPPPAPAPTSGS